MTTPEPTPTDAAPTPPSGSPFPTSGSPSTPDGARSLASAFSDDAQRPQTVASRKDAYEQLRRLSTWRLLSATKAPAVLAILQSVFPGGSRRLGRSDLVARVETHLELLHEDGQGRTAPEYVDQWVREGYVTRRDDPQHLETMFEPSPATIDAVQFISSLEEHRPTTTESRLQLVLQQFDRLAQETETDRDVRLADLQRRRAAIEQEIRDLAEGELMLPDPGTSVDRLQDILQIASELSGDFLQYREDLRAVDLHLREQILSPEASRGEILEQLLAGDDLLGQSQVGRTFTAFFRMLNDPAQTRRAQDVVDRLLERDFTRHLTRDDRERLANVFSDLYEPAQEVLDVKTELYRSLARFVRSQDFRQHRVLLDLLQEAQGLALAQKDEVSTRFPFSLDLRVARVRMASVSQHRLKDPTDPGAPVEAEVHDATTLSVEVLQDLVRTNDIDTVGLTGSVNRVRGLAGQASIGDVLREEPARQGLASVIGLMFLATQYAQSREGSTEVVGWRELDGKDYAAKVPSYYFLDDLPVE
ncbi:DUF3375 domain-containing protein [Brachybacterium endophyticum]|uniref:DUF3375 domain-containing protein n=1 Tax=Brachybacterium endophyticum TaxID=2182385 RepID=A0A2U2RMJ8_9MICO|nr:DUF3375 domain-containing protein [Brachybacterium endophyticum]PWH07004.1 DUF3375 domain-containing protein [Brachybacterium endophyticum]